MELNKKQTVVLFIVLWIIAAIIIIPPWHNRDGEHQLIFRLIGGLILVGLGFRIERKRGTLTPE